MVLFVDLVILVVCVILVLVLLVIVLIINILDVLDALDVLAKTRGLYQVLELSYGACSIWVSKSCIMYHGAMYGASENLILSWKKLFCFTLVNSFMHVT